MAPALMVRIRRSSGEPIKNAVFHPLLWQKSYVTLLVLCVNAAAGKSMTIEEAEKLTPQDKADAVVKLRVDFICSNC